jgi:hypothetical protein
MNENLILENFNCYITENSELFEEATSAMSIVTDQVTYDSYANKLLEGLEESESRRIKGMFDRQREVLLEESASLLGSPDAITYAVTSFPMLVDIYSDPLLSKVVSVYPSAVPTMTIPRLKWISKVIDHKGNVTELEFPTATKSVRTGHEMITVGQSGNAFGKLFEGTSTTNYSQFRLNKRNFKITNVVINADVGATDGALDYPIDMIAVADARGNFAAEGIKLYPTADPLLAFDAATNAYVTTPGSEVATFKIQGQINFESGDITWSAISMGGAAVASVTIDAKLRIMGVGNGLAVTKARPKQDVLDINCDIEDSFEIENIEEVIQDWKSLYNLDIIAQLKSYVKDQIKLNRDFEIADLLESNIPAAMEYGHYREIDLSTISGATDTKPASVQDIFKNIIPVLIALQETIKKATRFEIKYLVTGIDSAAVLKSMQSFAVKFEGFEGETGFSGETGSFSKLEVITSHAVGNDLIHLIPKSESLAQSSIVEISHKPLYVITETTDSVKRSFIKSRNWIGIVRNEALGTIRLKGYATALGLV